MGMAHTPEERGHNECLRDFGGEVFTIIPTNGRVPPAEEKKL